MGVNDVERFFSLAYKADKPFREANAHLLYRIWMQTVSGFKNKLLSVVIGKINRA